MNTKFSILLVVAFLSLCGCSPSIMTIKESESQTVNPIGLFVIGSTQVFDNNDSTHKDFVIQSTANFLPGFFTEKGYQMKPLNSMLRTDEVFSKYPFSFYIDEHRIAEIAKNNGCSSVLIVYFAYVGGLSTLGSGLNVYRNCSLYGWLVDTKDASVISDSHTRLNSLDRFLEISPPDLKAQPAGVIYENFLKYLTYMMFGGFPKISS